jgi:uncharacterized membrane protein
MTKILEFYKKIDKYYLILAVFCVIVFGSMVKINLFRYNNFDMGKFDLGNMTQMAWYTLKGKFMYLTDYFGSNVPRWSMSHVDPILVLFIPLFYFFPEPLTLVFAQNFLIIAASILIFEIAKIRLKNNFVALMISLSYLSYPALGFLLSWTGYHGVSPAIFFFLLFFFLIEKYKSESRTLKFKELFFLTLTLVITLAGKEQISLYFVVLGIYLFFTTSYKKYSVFISMFSLAWFIVCFFIVIPHYASYRIDSFEKFVTELNLNKADVPNVYSSNYFLSRYSEFGNSMGEIIKNMLLNPVKTASIFISGDKLDNLFLTFGPLMYLPFVHPATLVIAFPDLLINYSTSQGGIGTSEIYNHRISMIIPVLFISIIASLSFIKRFLSYFWKDTYVKASLYFIAAALFVTNLYFSNYVGEKNPIFSWIVEAVNKRVFAKSDTQVITKNLKIGDVTRLTPLDENDRECVRRIIDDIPPIVSVSGPDFIGSHLAQRETYSIFPAGKSTSDYIVIDIYSKKLLRILELDYSLGKDFISDVFASKNYKLDFVCGNLMVLKKDSSANKSNEARELLPVQRFGSYQEKVNYEIYNKLTVVDFDFSRTIQANSPMDLKYVYQMKSSKNLDGFVLFTSLVNKNSGEIFQVVNYPTFVFSDISNFRQDKFYEEKFKIIIPSYLEKGTYMVFVGMDNKINTRSVYLGDTELR